MGDYPKPPFPNQRQAMTGSTSKMNPGPDHGNTTYKGSGIVWGKCAIITDGDRGIGRTVAITYAREGADILISYLDEHEDAKEVAALIEKEGRKVVLMDGDLRSAEHCRKIIDSALRDLGGSRQFCNELRPAGSFKRAGQPAELAAAYVMLADPLSSYTFGTTVAVTGGKLFI